MKKFLRLFLLIILIFAGYLSYALTREPYKGMPELKDGDIVMQTAMTSQTNAILVATGSIYSHAGIVKKIGDKYNVVQTGLHVEEIPLDDWINQGNFKRFAVYRHSGMTQEKAQAIFAYATPLYGKGYDFMFLFNNDTYYCSELPYLAFKEQGLAIGQVQKIKELYVDNSLVKKVIEQRWQKHPVCNEKAKDFTECYDIIMNQELVTPVSLTRGEQVKQIFSNYPF